MNTSIINTTGILTKHKGDGLSAYDINVINGTLNQVVEAINPMLTSTVNLNAESGNYDRVYTREGAIRAVPFPRRNRGLKIKYLAETGFYEEITYLGDDVEGWYDLNNWGMGGVNVIDGGEW